MLCLFVEGEGGDVMGAQPCVTQPCVRVLLKFGYLNFRPKFELQCTTPHPHASRVPWCNCGILHSCFVLIFYLTKILHCATFILTWRK